MDQLELLRTKHLGQHFLYFDTIDSTNTYLKTCGDSLPHGTAVAAGYQYAGRGRQGHVWKSGENTLALSVLLKNVSPHTMPMLPILFGMAARRALSFLCAKELFLKWPNDLLCQEKKIGGILCEGVSFGSQWAAVCGVGVNLAQDRSYFEEAGLPYGSSLWLESGMRIPPAQAGGAILTAFEEILLQYEQEGFSLLREEYSQFCVNLGRQVRVITPQGEQTGLACGIGEDGALLVQGPDGVFPVRSGDASVRGLYGYV